MTHEELVIERKWLIEMASKQITQGLINSANRLNHKLGVKITSPSKNATVPAGQLTISGISSDTAITNCMVSAGKFIGVNDGIHNAEGVVKVIALGDGTSVLRLENFKATNGPDLYVYLSTDKSASDIVNLGRLKGNIGNQNYAIPAGTNLTKYNTALIWCKAFSVLFGSAQLASPQ